MIGKKWQIKNTFANKNPKKSIYIYIYIYIYINDVYLSGGMWRSNRNPNPCTDLGEILHTHPQLSKEGFGTGLSPAPTPLGLRGLKY